MAFMMTVKGGFVRLVAFCVGVYTEKMRCSGRFGFAYSPRDYRCPLRDFWAMGCEFE